jgi:hypothetical protein
MGGLGYLYKQRTSRFWWYKISVGKKVSRKSTEQISQRKAEAVLRSVLERIGASSFVPTETQVTFDEIAAGYVFTTSRSTAIDRWSIASQRKDPRGFVRGPNSARYSTEPHTALHPTTASLRNGRFVD